MLNVPFLQYMTRSLRGSSVLLVFLFSPFENTRASNPCWLFVSVGNGRSDRLPCLFPVSCARMLRTVDVFEWRPFGKTSGALVWLFDHKRAAMSRQFGLLTCI